MSKIKLIWEVFHWKKLWRTLWFRTANIKCDEKIEFWVYKTLVIFDWKKYKWASSYRENEGLFETHILDFEGDLYWKKIEIYILEKIRENKKPKDLEELKLAIKKDVQYVRENDFVVLTFGTFDVTHPGHKFYLKESSYLWDKLVTIVARDESVLKFKGENPLRGEEKRMQDIKDFDISDVVELGHPTDYYACINKWMPKIISLWYDQKSANVWLEKYLKNEKINSNIVIIEPFEENKFKSSIIKRSM